MRLVTVVLVLLPGSGRGGAGRAAALVMLPLPVETCGRVMGMPAYYSGTQGHGQTALLVQYCPRCWWR